MEQIFQVRTPPRSDLRSIAKTIQGPPRNLWNHRIHHKVDCNKHRRRDGRCHCTLCRIHREKIELAWSHSVSMEQLSQVYRTPSTILHNTSLSHHALSSSLLYRRNHRRSCG